MDVPSHHTPGCSPRVSFSSLCNLFLDTILFRPTFGYVFPLTHLLRLEHSRIKNSCISVLGTLRWLFGPSSHEGSHWNDSSSPVALLYLAKLLLTVSRTAEMGSSFWTWANRNKEVKQFISYFESFTLTALFHLLGHWMLVISGPSFKVSWSGALITSVKYHCNTWSSILWSSHVDPWGKKSNLALSFLI